MTIVTIDGRGVFSTNDGNGASANISIVGPLKITGSLTSLATNFSIYVDAINGNDTNSGGSPTSAVKTLTQAMALIPTSRAVKKRMYFASGTYTVPSDFYFNGPQVIGNEEPLVLIGTFSQSFTGTVVTAQNGATNRNGFYGIISGSFNLNVDQFVGYRLRMLTGADSGSVYIVASNSGSSITIPSIGFSAVPSNGDQFVLETPSTIFSSSGIGLAGPMILGPNPIAFYGINFTGACFLFLKSDAIPRFESCIFNFKNAGYMYCIHANPSFCSLIDSTIGFPTLTDISPSTGRHGNYFVSSSNTTLGLAVDSSNVYATSIVSRNAGIYLTNGATLNLDSFDTITGSFTDIRGSSVNVNYYLNITASTQAGITLQDKGQLHLQNGAFIYNATGDGITLDRGSILYTVTTIGNGNTGYGISAFHGSQAYVGDPNTGTTITGSLGAAKVGGNSTVSTWAGVAGGSAGQTTDISASSPQFCRIGT